MDDVRNQTVTFNTHVRVLARTCAPNPAFVRAVKPASKTDGYRVAFSCGPVDASPRALVEYV